MTDSKMKSLYFHMGPGFHSKIEALKFSARFPHVMFLDQPLGLNFAELVTWAEETIREQARLSQEPLCLLGHSFGAQLITHALPKIAEFVGEIRFLNSAYDSFDCFANLETTLFPQTAQGPQYWKQQSATDKMNMIFQLAQNPQMADAYWHNPAAQAEYMKMAADFPSLDIPAFVVAFSGYLNRKDLLPKPLWQGKVKIYYSLSDNLIKSFATMQFWKFLFPQVRFTEIPDIGHYGLFESEKLANEFFKT